MNRFCLSAAALLWAAQAVAAPIGFEGTFGFVEQSFVVSPTNEWMDKNRDTDDEFDRYDEAATLTELREHFGADLTFADVTWDVDDRTWNLNSDAVTFDKAVITFFFETDDFGQGNLTSDGFLFQQIYAGNNQAILTKNGSEELNATLPSFVTAVGKNVSLDDNVTGDAIAFFVDTGDDSDSTVVAFARFLGDTTWFDEVASGGNALEYALSTPDFTGLFEIESQIDAVDGADLGLVRNTSFLTSHRFFAAPNGAGVGSPAPNAAPVPLPLPAALLMAGVGGLAVLRRFR